MAPHSRSHPAGRWQRRVWPFVLLASAIGLAAGTGACAKSQPVGTCVRSDTSVAGTNMTQADCQKTCPTCTWTQGS